MEFPDGRIERHDSCRVLAAGNTLGQGANAQFVGRMQLDFASMNRFGAKIHVPIDLALEETLTLSQGADETLAKRHLARVRELRAKADSFGTERKFDFTPRNSIDGASLLAIGFTLAEVEVMTLQDTVSPADWKRLNS